MRLTTYDLAILLTRPIAYYPLTEMGIIAKNIAPASSSLDGNPIGTPRRGMAPLLYNDPSPSTGFDGSTSAFSVPSGILNGSLSEITVACWIRTPLTGSYGRFCSTNEASATVAGFDFNEGAPGDTEFYWTISSGAAMSQLLSGAGTCLPDTTYFVCGAYNHVLNRLYVNGIQVGLNATTITIGAGAAMQIGRDGAGFGFYEGKISRLAIWNRGLTPGQIMEFYKLGLQPSQLRRTAYSNVPIVIPAGPPGFFANKGRLGPRQT